MVAHAMQSPASCVVGAPHGSMGAYSSLRLTHQADSTATFECRVPSGLARGDRSMLVISCDGRHPQDRSDLSEILACHYGTHVDICNPVRCCAANSAGRCAIGSCALNWAHLNASLNTFSSLSAVLSRQRTDTFGKGEVHSAHAEDRPNVARFPEPSCVHPRNLRERSLRRRSVQLGRSVAPRSSATTNRLGAGRVEGSIGRVRQNRRAGVRPWRARRDLRSSPPGSATAALRPGV